MDVASITLDGNADTVEFCPYDTFYNILSAATYTLEEGTQQNRSGSISLFSVNDDEGLELLQRVQTVGVFHIKWSPLATYKQPLLAQADAAGCLILYNLESTTDAEERGLMLRELCTEKISSSMCLCVDWNQVAGSLSVGHSDGSLSVVAFKEDCFQVAQTWAAHQYELWTTAFDISRPEILYAGSDDCVFSCWDLRERPSHKVFQNTKSHTMGVCCIAQDPQNTSTLLTSSYDECIRVWDVRSTSLPVHEKSLSLGGGVWRIKFHPHLPGIVLAACMHNGFAIVELGEENLKVMETYSKHGSLAYGADWHKGGSSAEDTLVATCSFYDKHLRIWKPASLMIK